MKIDLLLKFVGESNRIEGIMETTLQQVQAHADFLSKNVTVTSLVQLVSVLQPDAKLRNRKSVPGVKVGKHIAPSSGAEIEHLLEQVIAMHDPWTQHTTYEHLHPFTDGNGRSGRALWLHRFQNPQFEGLLQRGFLHTFYYQTLAGMDNLP